MDNKDNNSEYRGKLCRLADTASLQMGNGFHGGKPTTLSVELQGNSRYPLEQDLALLHSSCGTLGLVDTVSLQIGNGFPSVKYR